MPTARPSIVVTGACGNLGRRLLPLLSGFRVLALDMHPPAEALAGGAEFERLDLGQESSCNRIVELLRANDCAAVVHLAFVIDPQQTGVLDETRMWQINVAGTARVVEAIAETNRLGGHVERFVVPSSVSVYGPETTGEVMEDYPLNAYGLAYAVHKKEADRVVQARARHLGLCSTFLLRPHIFAGQSMQNYLVGALRGTPTGRGKLGGWLRRKKVRMPMLLPWGESYRQKRFQFVHVDDVARLIVHILECDLAGPELRVLNVAGRGESITLGRCAEVAGAKVRRLPTQALCRLALRLLWDAGISAVPPDALPYMCGSYTMNTAQLRKFLGDQYRHIIRYTNEEALADSFAPAPTTLDRPERLTAAR